MATGYAQQRGKMENRAVGLGRHDRTLILTVVAMVLLGVTGLIHLIEMPDNYSDAAYKGILFLLNGIAAGVAMYGISRGARWWGWGLGLLVTAGAFILYFVSRTIGLPGLGVDPKWTEPIGILSLLVEAGYIITFVLAFVAPKAAGNGHAQALRVRPHRH